MNKEGQHYSNVTSALQRRARPRLCSPAVRRWGCCTLAISLFSQCTWEVSEAVCTGTQQMPAEQLDQMVTGQIIFLKFSHMGRDHTTTKSCLWTNKRHQFTYISEDLLHGVFCYLSFIRSVWSCTKREYRGCEGLKYLHLLSWAIMCSYYSQTSNCIISSWKRKPLSIKDKNSLLILKANTACMEISSRGFKGQECTIQNTDPEETTLGSIITEDT